MTRGQRHDLLKGLAFLSPWLFGFLVFTVGPAALSFYYSLCSYSLLQPPVYIGAENYRRLFTDDVFWISLINTGYYALLAIPSSLVASLALALLLTLNVRGQGIYRTIVFLPSLVPLVASAMLWLWLLNGKLGLFNMLLAKVGIHGPAWLTDVMFHIGSGDDQRSFYWVLPALAFMNLWGVGQTVTIFIAGLGDVPRELYEAAHIDGAGPIRRLFGVTVPLLSPVIFFNLIMSIIGTLQVFAIPYIMTSGGPARASYFFTMYLYENAFHFLKMGYASAMAWIQLLVILILTAIAFWSSKRWVHYQAK